MTVVMIVWSLALVVSHMYLFLAFCSLLDACVSSIVTPKKTIDLFYNIKNISFECCMTQVFVVQFFIAVEAIILAVTAYDHYVALCQPLDFSSVMS